MYVCVYVRKWVIGLHTYFLLSFVYSLYKLRWYLTENDRSKLEIRYMRINRARVFAYSLFYKNVTIYYVICFDPSFMKDVCSCSRTGRTLARTLYMPIALVYEKHFFCFCRFDWANTLNVSFILSVENFIRLIKRTP